MRRQWTIELVDDLMTFGWLSWTVGPGDPDEDQVARVQLESAEPMDLMLDGRQGHLVG